MSRFLLIAFCFAFCGCSQFQTNDEGLRTVPVTNNPRLLPGDTSTLPLMPSEPATR